MSSDHFFIQAVKSNFAFIEFSTSGVISDANDYCLNLLDYDFSDLIGKNHKVLVNPIEAQSPQYANFWNSLSKGITQDDFFKRVTKNGNIIYLKATYFPIFDEKNNLTKIVALATDQTKKYKETREAFIVKKMVDESSNSRMFSTPDGVMVYINQASKENLKKVETALPDQIDNLVGKNIDWLHENPQMFKELISNPNNLPKKIIINLGNEKIELNISAVFYEEEYVYTNYTWSIITGRSNMLSEVSSVSEDLTNASNRLTNVSQSLAAAAGETSIQSATASSASEEVNAGVQTLTSNMSQMVLAIKEITKTTNDASLTTQDAMNLTKETNSIIDKLGKSSIDIGSVIKVISSIAQQTNLLALNATIEAARAGDAGRGFAVVANEVKELSKQTSNATQEITKRIEAIQLDSKNAVLAVGNISIAIEKVNGFASSIAVAVEEQAATTSEVNRVISESAEGVAQITKNISEVRLAAEMTGKNATEANVEAKSLSDLAIRLKELIKLIS